MTDESCYIPPWNRGGGAQYKGEVEAGGKLGLNAVVNALNQIYDLLSAQGVLDFFESSIDSVGTTLHPQLPYARWLKVSVENTGSNRLYFKANGKSSSSEEPYVSPGGTFSFDVGRNVIYSIELRSEVNTTTSYRVYAVK